MDVTSAAADNDDGRGPGGNKRKRNGEGGGTSYLHLAVKEREKKKAREWKGGSTDVLILIFARLNPLSLACCSVVCRTWKQVVDGSPSLWKKVYAEQHTGSLNSRFVKLNKAKEEAGAEESDWKALAIDELQRANLVQGTLSVHVWKAHSTRVNACQMNMDTILSASADQIMAAAGAEVWLLSRTDKGRVIRRMGGYGQRLYCMRYADPELAVGCADGSMRVYDLYSGRCSRLFRKHSAPVTSVAINAAAQIFVSGCRDGKVQMFDALSGQDVVALLRPIGEFGVDSLQMGMNDHLLFAGTTTGFVYCWDLRTHQELWRIRAHRSVVTSMHSQAYAPSTLLTGSMDGVVKLFDCNSGTMLKAFKPICEPPSVHSASSIPNVLNAQRLQTQQSSTTQAPILCARLGMTQVLTSHTDGTLALCKSSI
ncbi:hypothetical protein BDL97_06G022800 [Sphagnum fallax]|nr:hypothetical protein BDL97_06G022800 [Sphagnum fallax]